MSTSGFFHSFKLTPTRLLLLASAFMVLTGNFLFFEKLTDVYPWAGNAGFLVSLTVFQFCVNALMLLVFSLILPVRIVVSLFLLITAVMSYFSDQLGIVIDEDMIRNILQTNLDEATDLVNSGMLLHVVTLGVVPVVLLWILPFSKTDMLRETRYKGQIAAGVIIALVLSIMPLSDHYASFVREHKPLRYYMHPFSVVFSFSKFIRNEILAAQEHHFTTLSKNVKVAESDTHQELIILVVGETARADHFSLNGYQRETNPMLSKVDRLISYSNISSCGTSTAVSVPCMFAYSDRENFDVGAADYTENALDMLNRAGVNILWRDNNSDSKGVAARVTYQDFKTPDINPDCDVECRDAGMLDGLQDYIDHTPGEKLVILHTMGSHGPAYYKRYPKEFEKFKPACNTLELSQCTTEEITNAYDNTIVYTDYFLSKVIELLKKNTPRYETAMFYVSDHGESLGEAGLYLHGMPYIFAPEEQTRVPIILWVAPNSDIDYKKTLELKDKPNSHDALFGAILSSFEIEADLDFASGQPLVFVDDDD